MVVHTYGNIVAKTKKHEMHEQGSEHKEKESEHRGGVADVWVCMRVLCQRIGVHMCTSG